jgi:hypothetical protein
MEDVLGNPGQMGGRLVNVQKMAVLGLSTSPVSGTVFVDGVSCGVGSPGLEIQVPVPAGAHQVSFGLFAGYAAPSNQYLSLRAGEVRHVVGIYVATVVAPTGGGLNVTTTPVSGGIFVDGDEVGAGSVYMTIQTGRFRNSLNIDPGSHVVSFEAVSGYTTPAPQTVNVTVGTTLNVVGTYVATVVPPPPPVVIAKSYLQVTTTPWAGGIVIDGVSRGNAPVTLEVAAGSHTVSFGAITGGYTTPAAQTVNVVAGQTVDVLGIYTAIVVTPPPTPPPPPPPTSTLTVMGWINEWVVTDYKNPSLYGYWRKRYVRFLSYSITKDGAVVKTTWVGSSNGDSYSLAPGTYKVQGWNYTVSPGFTAPAAISITLPGTVELIWQGTKP